MQGAGKIWVETQLKSASFAQVRKQMAIISNNSFSHRPPPLEFWLYTPSLTLLRLEAGQFLHLLELRSTTATRMMKILMYKVASILLLIVSIGCWGFSLAYLDWYSPSSLDISFNLSALGIIRSGKAMICSVSSSSQEHLSWMPLWKKQILRRPLGSCTSRRYTAVS